MFIDLSDRCVDRGSLPEIGCSSQEKLALATVVIFGCGALGSAAAELLTRAGVGQIRQIDIHPVINLKPVSKRQDVGDIDRLIGGANLVLDGTGDDRARNLINRACLQLGTPWIFAGVCESYGLMMNIVPGETPCFECVFGLTGRDDHQEQEISQGSWSIGTSILASLQAGQAIQLLLGNKRYSRGLIYVDSLAPSFEKMEIKGRGERCPACGFR